ncbi:SMP-30/gluconolactonase/LRE family protein (plasmid) [Sulfitobacter sp. W027]|uniref:SMP-30/gluconolactonase/LRE family protein n=1 Tax=Sulfitobacter sp. W027 TaxID=2867025 RepID=UPI0021A51971|nr:SMP-30/gluconolactonase/LRE family protein [Sulfitobacter sp. W027]UWR35813.1 SMP-30/gluconolactonase/LRE family protein [Sulfitobacter sp. W027]
MGKVQIERLDTGFDCLGESPVWDSQNQSLWWIDGVAGKIHERRADGSVQTLEVTGHVGAIALVEGAGIVATIDRRVMWLDPDTKVEQLLGGVEDAPEAMRLNDGKLDRQGRFVCIGMGRGGEAIGNLHSFGLSTDRVLAKTGVMIGNGVCFSPDGGTLYFSDTRARTSYAAQYDIETGAVGQIRAHIDCVALGSGIDGATVDRDGNMWASLIHSAQIGCFAPDGTLLLSIPAPVDLPSSLAFGGADMDVLFLTSIRDSGTGRAVSKHPEGGGVFAIRGHGATGIEEARFQGAKN